MRNDPQAHRYCRKCGTPIDPDPLGRDNELCHQCKVSLAEEYVTHTTAKGISGSVPETRTFRIGLWAVLLLCAGITLTQIPVFRKALRNPKPIRAGVYETDARTDACIQNLWQAARILQERQIPGPELVCPVSGKSYRIVKQGNATLILCPNPEKHGIRNLRLSSESMVPEVTR